MLASEQTLNQAILALTPLVNQHIALVNFVDVVADFMDQVQAGPTGSPGILTVNRPVFVAQLETQVPVADSSWIPNFADAWYMGVAQGTITPGTVSAPAWAGGSGTDTQTSASPVATITTLMAAKALLQAELANVMPDNTAALPMAKAIRDATLAMTFLCVGLNPSSSPVSVSFPAQ